jgi:hypothetical protein
MPAAKASHEPQSASTGHPYKTSQPITAWGWLDQMVLHEKRPNQQNWVSGV